MELDLQSLFGLLSTAVPYSLAETPQLPPLPPHLGSNGTRALFSIIAVRELYWSAKIDEISL
jgi:hypothetical protein